MLKISGLYIQSLDNFIMYPATITISVFDKCHSSNDTAVILETPEGPRNGEEIYIDHKLCNRATSRILGVLPVVV